VKIKSLFISEGKDTKSEENTFKLLLQYLLILNLPLRGFKELFENVHYLIDGLAASSFYDQTV